MQQPTMYVDGQIHTEFAVEASNNGSQLGYDSCTDGTTELFQVGQQRIALETMGRIQCGLTGMVPNESLIEVFGDDVLIYS